MEGFRGSPPYISPFCNNITRVDEGGVAFDGNKKTLYNVNLYSRTGMYVLKKIDSFKANHTDGLYNNIKMSSLSRKSLALGKTIWQLLKSKKSRMISAGSVHRTADQITIPDLSDSLRIFPPAKRSAP